mmetsp:Transcript_4386/g.27953  ORF Transcript_4386/g.27953 Transcript_4386/m.27953 type:complete len:356 (+) Transcript_4386:53-1120(+)
MCLLKDLFPSSSSPEASRMDPWTDSIVRAVLWWVLDLLPPRAWHPVQARNIPPSTGSSGRTCKGSYARPCRGSNRSGPNLQRPGASSQDGDRENEYSRMAHAEWLPTDAFSCPVSATYPWHWPTKPTIHRVERRCSSLGFRQMARPSHAHSAPSCRTTVPRDRRCPPVPGQGPFPQNLRQTTRPLAERPFCWALAVLHATLYRLAVLDLRRTVPFLLPHRPSRCGFDLLVHNPLVLSILIPNPCPSCPSWYALPYLHLWNTSGSSGVPGGTPCLSRVHVERWCFSLCCIRRWPPPLRFVLPAHPRSRFSGRQRCDSRPVLPRAWPGSFPRLGCDPFRRISSLRSFPPVPVPPPAL